jgi:hypothetical protein
MGRLLRATYYFVSDLLRYFAPKNEGCGAWFPPPTTSSIITTRNVVFGPAGLFNIFPSPNRLAELSSSSLVAVPAFVLLVGTLSNPDKFDSFRINPRSYLLAAVFLFQLDSNNVAYPCLASWENW